MKSTTRAPRSGVRTPVSLVAGLMRPVGWLLCGLCFVGEVSAASVSSPDGVLAVVVTTDGDGRPHYAVSRQGKSLIEASRLGFLLSDAPALDRQLAVGEASVREVDERWEQPWGERRFVRNRYREMRVPLQEQVAPHRRFDVVFRVHDDGLGFRYEFPDQKTLPELNIVEELTEFAVADEATAWWIPGGEWNRYEYLYRKTPLRELAQAHTPMTIKTESGVYIAFHEAALVDYAGLWLRRVDGQRLRAELAPSPRGPKVSRAAPFQTPWRTLQIADSAAGLYQSDLILNLNEPNRLGDVSWFTPAKYVGVWWEMHLDRTSWASGARHGATTENAKRYIDFAAEHGFRGVLVEGWNRGWDGDWFGKGDAFSFTEAYPDFDLDAVAAYARARGVHLIGHHETAGNVARYETQLDAALDLYAGLGVDVVKTGYVADAGGVQLAGENGPEYGWHDGQAMSRHHLKVVQAAAERRIAINSHEPIKDTGLRRTYPNWVSREGARGMEFNAWGEPINAVDHVVNLVFTRMLAGPMDYTPGVLSLQGQGGRAILSTMAKQLALYVVLYSPIQMAADLPEHYEQHPGPFQFIKDVPTDWADTRVLGGEIGDFVLIARQDRNSEDWYLGGVTDEQARTLTIDLDFLAPGRDYRAQIYRDGDDADYRENRQAIEIEQRTVRAGQSLRLRLAPGGGVAIRFAADV